VKRTNIGDESWGVCPYLRTDYDMGHEYEVRSL